MVWFVRLLLMYLTIAEQFISDIVTHQCDSEIFPDFIRVNKKFEIPRFVCLNVCFLLIGYAVPS